MRGLLSVEALRVSRRAAHDEAPGRNPNVALAGGDDNLPVEQVTWDEAKHFCEAVGGRLPTEAEWEYAARARERRVNAMETWKRSRGTPATAAPATAAAKLTLWGARRVTLGTYTTCWETSING